jgi:hypothetical protein
MMPIRDVGKVVAAKFGNPAEPCRGIRRPDPSPPMADRQRLVTSIEARGDPDPPAASSREAGANDAAPRLEPAAVPGHRLGGHLAAQSTFSISPGRQVLSNHGSRGP